MSTLSPSEQEIFNVAKSSLPRFLFQSAQSAQELFAAAAKTFGAAKDTVYGWFTQTYIEQSSGFWTDQHAKDRNMRRQSTTETDATLAARVTTIEDAVTLPAFIALVTNMLIASGASIAPGFVELRLNGGYFEPLGNSARAFFDRGYRMGTRGRRVIVILPYGTSAATAAAVADALRTIKAAGIAIIVEIRGVP